MSNRYDKRFYRGGEEISEDEFFNPSKDRSDDSSTFVIFFMIIAFITILIWI